MEYLVRAARVTDIDRLVALSDDVLRVERGAGTLDAAATAAAGAVYHATGAGSLDTDATATAGGTDHNDIDFLLGRPHSGWVVSPPWR